MRLFVSLSAAMLFLVLVLTACNSTEQSRAGAAAANASNSPASSPQQASNVPADGVRRITTVELKNMLDKGEALVVDVRASSSWDAGHIRGARHIPTDQILSAADTLPRDKTIVTYCS